MAEKSRNQTNLEMIRHVNATIMGCNPGMTRAEFEKIKNYHFNPDWSVAEVVDASIFLGEIKWDGDVLVRNMDTIKLTPEAERVLREKVAGKKVDIHSLVSRALIHFLKQEDS